MGEMQRVRNGRNDGARHRSPGRRRGARGAAVLTLLGLILPTSRPAAAPAAFVAVAPPASLPAAAALALEIAQVPREALAVVIEELGVDRPVLALNDERLVNPASLAKLVTTAAALDMLGPAWRWRTPVWIDGPVRDGVLAGTLAIRGSGDPTLVLERLWLLLHRVRETGVREIRGDIVLDGSAFAPAADGPGDFDGEAGRPYNVQPDALLLNFKSVTYTFVPDPARGLALVLAAPALGGLPAAPPGLPLAPGPCGDWRAGIRPAPAAADGLVRFEGRYPAACGEQQWSIADARPASYNARLVEAMWRELGGTLAGRVRAGPAPATVPSFEFVSPPLADVVRDINKYSNNVMARQLFLTLDLVAHPERAADAASARATLHGWLEAHLGALPPGVALDNGAGLAREGRLTARLLARLLVQAWDGPNQPEFVASLPIFGVDGTLRRVAPAAGTAHLKTGSLRDVSGLAGYVRSESGRRYVLVAIVNHPEANAARPALEAIVRWTLHDAVR